MLYIVSMVAYGDSLITLSLLERLKSIGEPYQILGSAVTREVSALLQKPLPVLTLLDHEVALYTLRRNGLWRGFRDFVALRHAFGRMARRGDVFAFEFSDVRNAALVPVGCSGRYAGERYGTKMDSVYQDRHRFIADVLGDPGALLPAASPVKNIERIVINPIARHRSRWLAPETIDVLLDIARRKGWSVTLVDVQGAYGAYDSAVCTYLRQPSLVDAAAHLRDSDLYIGPDSFFLHLAYYYRIPCFGFFLPGHSIYLLPGMRELGNCLTFGERTDGVHLEARLLEFVDRHL